MAASERERFKFEKRMQRFEFDAKKQTVIACCGNGVCRGGEGGNLGASYARLPHSGLGRRKNNSSLCPFRGRCRQAWKQWRSFLKNERVQTSRQRSSSGSWPFFWSALRSASTSGQLTFVPVQKVETEFLEEIKNVLQQHISRRTGEQFEDEPVSRVMERSLKFCFCFLRRASSNAPRRSTWCNL